MQRLQQEGIACAAVDITAIGSWYTRKTQETALRKFKHVKGKLLCVKYTYILKYVTIKNTTFDRVTLTKDKF